MKASKNRFQHKTLEYISSNQLRNLVKIKRMLVIFPYNINFQVLALIMMQWKHQFQLKNSNMENFSKFWGNQTKMKDFYDFFHKTSSFELLDGPFWCHKMTTSSSKYRNMLKFVCSNFLPNFEGVKRKRADFYEIFHKISSF